MQLKQITINKKRFGKIGITPSAWFKAKQYFMERLAGFLRKLNPHRRV